MLKIAGGLKGVVRTLTSTAGKNATPKLAPLQEAALEERCILVDELDNPIGDVSKRDCHKVGPNKQLMLHRAFSVFLFNQKGELLLQKRAPTKITFPNYYTNTCCSHPLMEVPGESEAHDGLGVKKAAQRRLAYELGIPMGEIKLNEFSYITRFIYKGYDDAGIWGEHELDYVLFVQKDNVTLDPNPDEISEISWVSKENMDKFIQECPSPISPWFKIIYTHKLSSWWNNLKTLDKITDHKTVYTFL